MVDVTDDHKPWG